MFASQLLRILQTLPTQVNHEACAFDKDELKATMKEVTGRSTDSLAPEVNGKDGFWNAPELECSMVVDDFTDGKENEKLRNSLPPCAVRSGFYEKDTDCDTDKNVMECELPELIVCYNDNAYHVIKDICIDEGIPSENKILIDNNKDNHVVICTSLPVNGDKHGGMIKGGLDNEFLIEDGLRSSSGKDFDKNAAIECGTKERLDTDLLIPDGHKDLCTSLATNDHCDMSKVTIDTEFPIQEGLKSSPGKNCEEDAAKECRTKGKLDINLLIPDEKKQLSEDDTDAAAAASKCGPDGLKLPAESNSDQDASNNCDYEDLTQTGEVYSNPTDKVMDDMSPEELVSNSLLTVKEYCAQTSLKFLLEASDSDVNYNEQRPGQIAVEEISKSPAVVVSGAEVLCKSGQTANILYDSKVESGTITFNFDSGKAAAIIGENEHDLPLQSQNVPPHNHEDRTSDSFPLTSQVQRGEGESSFSATGPVSGLITYSGPIAFSGSISLRSDSSTTSTRSFAFPILQSEWNSSPVKMAKTDQRRFRKHRGWRQGLLCCRF